MGQKVATKGKIQAIEVQYQRPIMLILSELYQKHGGNQKVIGAELGVSQSTVSLWLMRCGLRSKKVLDHS